MKTSLSKHGVSEYTVVFQEEINGGFSVWVPDLPGCVSQGESFEEALRNIKESIALYLEDNAQATDSESYKKQFVMPVAISNA